MPLVLSQVFDYLAGQHSKSAVTHVKTLLADFSFKSGDERFSEFVKHIKDDREAFDMHFTERQVAHRGQCALAASCRLVIAVIADGDMRQMLEEDGLTDDDLNIASEALVMKARELDAKQKRMQREKRKPHDTGMVHRPDVVTTERNCGHASPINDGSKCTSRNDEYVSALKEVKNDLTCLMEVTCDPVAQAWMKSMIKRMDTTLGPDSSEGQGHLFST